MAYPPEPFTELGLAFSLSVKTFIGLPNPLEISPPHYYLSYCFFSLGASEYTKASTMEQCNVFDSSHFNN